MRINYASHIDYEPLSLTLRVPAAFALESEGIEKIVADWLRDRSTSNPCPNGCTQKFLLVRPRDKHQLQVLLQWVCLACLPSLIAFLEKSISQLEEVQIGHNVTLNEETKIEKSRILEIGERTVTFEDGHQETVKAFKITQYAVSVAEYARFCDETGYQTMLERRKWPSNYRRNPLAPRDSDDARMLAYEDAKAFCEHRGVRLPTEAEFLAAALIDDNVRTLGGEQIAEIGKSADVLKAFAPLITATLTEGGVVIRRGPHIVKQSGWQDSPSRAIFALDKPAGTFCFCLPAEAADPA